MSPSEKKRRSWRCNPPPFTYMEQNADQQLPRHIAIILDGNGRWAKKRNLARSFGHREGAKAVTPLVRHCNALGIPFLTLYVFSTENWKRPAVEIEGIMQLLRQALDQFSALQNENVRVHILGDITRLPLDLQSRIREAEQNSAENTGLTLNLALNYGGREEILSAARRMAAEIVAHPNGKIDWTEECFSSYLNTAGQPDVDLLIRPGGEQRISNFLLWQSAYAEFVFTPVLWPDFTSADLDAAIAIYSKRNRRYGGLAE